MKKNILKGLAFVALVASMMFTSCNNGSSFINDVEPDASEITVKAFPGFNYITWTPVTGADIFVYRDDGADVTTAYFWTIDTDIQHDVEYTYTAYTSFTADPVKFQYSGVDPTSITESETPAYMTSQVSTSASCKAINPSYIKDGRMMTALELCEYEVGGNSDYVINEDNIVLNTNYNYFQFAFPTKSYLRYEPVVLTQSAIDSMGLEFAFNLFATFPMNSYSGSCTIGKQYNPDNLDQTDPEFNVSFYTNDGTLKVRRPIFGSGTYKLAVGVTAVNDSMYDASIVLSSSEVEVKALDARGTEVLNSDYIDEGKTIRIIWQPAVKSDATYWGAENYVIYARTNYDFIAIGNVKTAKVDEDGDEVEDEDGNVIYEFKNAAKADTRAGEPILYCDIAVENNKIKNNFIVVLSDNGMYENIADFNHISCTVDEYEELPELYTGTYSNNNYVSTSSSGTEFYTNRIAQYSISNVDLENPETGVANDVRIVFESCAKDFVIKSAKYKVLNKWDNIQYESSNLVVDSEMTEVAAVPSIDYTKYDIIVKDQAADTILVFLICVGYKDHADKYFVLTSAAIAPSVTIGTGEWDVSGNLETDPRNASRYRITVTPGTWEKYTNYTYAVYKTVLNTKNQAVDSTCTWEPVEINIAKNSSNVYTGDNEITVDPKDTDGRDSDGAATSWEGYIAFKLVKTNKNSNAFAVDYYYAPITVTKNK